MKRLVFDLDNTICIPTESDYTNAIPNLEVISKLKDYKQRGFEIIIFTSRNMRTYQGLIGKINAVTLPKIINWLDFHGVPYDEIHVGKPWCGNDGFYIDDKAIRPNEFCELTYEDISKLIGEN